MGSARLSQLSSLAGPMAARGAAYRGSIPTGTKGEEMSAGRRRGRREHAAPGLVKFNVGGEPLQLTVFNGSTPGSLHVLFTDATSGVTTYQACRSLSAAAPGAGGAVTLDFNRAVNLPCAYTEFATCPLPPPENRLPVAVEAGEMIPFHQNERWFHSHGTG